MVRDDLGDDVPLAGPPTTIASLVPSLTETVALWGLADTLLAVTEHCIEPGGAFPRAERIRGTKNPDVARIVALRPDLVLADQEENRRIDVERLRARGIPVWVTRVRSVLQAAASMRRLGVVLDRREEGASLADAIEAEATATSAAPPAPAVCFIWRDGPHLGPDERWWTVGPDTFAGDLMRCAGLHVDDRGEDDRYPRVRLEDVRRSGPRIVLLPDEPYDFADRDEAVFADWQADVLRCSGQPLFWWGPRTPEALRWLRSRIVASVPPDGGRRPGR